MYKEGVKAISWALYAPKGLCQPNENKVQSPADAQEEVVSYGDLLHLEEATNKLRSSKHHALCDLARSALWVFSLRQDGRSSEEDTSDELSFSKVTEPLELASEHSRSARDSDTDAALKRPARVPLSRTASLVYTVMP